jgi:ATP-binding cassette, subfamily F, member 3
MAELNGAKASLESRLAAGRPAAELARDGKELKALNDELHALEERWLALSGDLEMLETTREGS